MKYIFTVCCLFNFLISNGQKEFPSPFQFTLIDSCKGSKSDLFLKSHTWMAKTFTSSKDVLQMQDKEAGRLIGKAIITCNGQKNGFGQPLGMDYIHYTITIDIKDGKYRCILSDYYHEGGSYNFSKDCGSLDAEKISGVGLGKYWKYIRETAFTKSENLLSDLKTYMKKGNDGDF